MNWNYLAGFFDGEGSVTFQWNKNKLKNVIISISQCNKDVLEQIQNFVGDGGVYCNRQTGSKKWKPHWKPSWHWRMSRQDSVLNFLKKIKDLVIVKRELVISAINKLQEYKKVQACKKQKARDIFTKIQTMKKQGLSWREIGDKVNMKPESARGFYRYRMS